MQARLRTAAVSGALAGALTLGATAQTPADRKLELSFPSEGVVTLVAANVTVREILTEWTQQTGAVFTNAEQLTGGPITVQYEGLPEVFVVDSLLRSAAGYLVAPRGQGRVGTSSIASVYIIPTSQGTATTSYSPTPSAPVAAPLLTPGSPNDEIPPVTPPAAGAPAEVPPADPARSNTPGIIPIRPVTPVVGRGRGGGGGTNPPTPPPTGRGTGS